MKRIYQKLVGVHGIVAVRHRREDEGDSPVFVYARLENLQCHRANIKIIAKI